MHPIAGDGNCMFRSLSHQLFGTPEKHFAVRSLLIRFESKNRGTFSKLLTEINSPDIQSHIRTMTLPGRWGTHVELLAAATYFQTPVFYLRAPSSEYKWEVFNPLGPPERFMYQLCPEIDTSGDNVHVPDHFELLYSSDSHYDSGVHLVHIAGCCRSRGHRMIPDSLGVSVQYWHGCSKSRNAETRNWK